MNNIEQLENYISLIQPNIIVHLAGISSSIKAFEDPIQSIYTNGLLIANICKIIHKNNWNIKVFNASSSEIYKGHLQYNVLENDNNMHHCHPYSIAKILGHYIVDFYRNTYNLPFSNGILFTTEGKNKGQDFLLNKVARHAKSWHINHSPLNLANLLSYRNIIHVKDVINAICIIIKQPHGDNYLICNEKSEQIINLVTDIYKKYNICLEQRNIEQNINEPIMHAVYYDAITQLPVINILPSTNGLDNEIVNISGFPQKLLNLGWEIQYSYEDILNEIVSL